jgi:hypothetical protein
MKDDSIHAVMATWAAKDLPGRLSVAETAKVLGFAEHDIQILMSTSRLKPLGDPAPNAPKWFAAIEIIQRATDPEWLSKATKEVARYWRFKRERGQSAPDRLRKCQGAAGAARSPKAGALAGEPARATPSAQTAQSSEGR